MVLTKKGVGASLGFRLMGLTLTIALNHLHKALMLLQNGLKKTLKDLLGSVMYVNTDPVKVAEKILADIDEKRAALGWAEVK